MRELYTVTLSSHYKKQLYEFARVVQTGFIKAFHYFAGGLSTHNISRCDTIFGPFTISVYTNQVITSRPMGSDLMFGVPILFANVAFSWVHG